MYKNVRELLEGLQESIDGNPEKIMSDYEYSGVYNKKVKSIILFLVRNWNTSIEVDFQKRAGAQDLVYRYFIDRTNFGWLSIADQKKMAKINSGDLYIESLLATPLEDIKNFSTEAVKIALIGAVKHKNRAKRSEFYYLMGRNALQKKLIEIQEYAAKHGNIKII